MSATIDNAPPGTPCQCDAPSPHDARWIVSGYTYTPSSPDYADVGTVSRACCVRNYPDVIRELLGEPPK